MAKMITATDLRAQIRRVIQTAQFQGDHVIVTVFDKPAVAIMGIDDYRDYLAYRDRGQEGKENKEPPRAMAQEDSDVFDELTDEELYRKLGI